MKKTSSSKNNINNIDNEIKIEGLETELNEDTTLITVAELNQKQLERAMYNYENNKNHIYTRYLDDESANNSTLTIQQINDLARNTQNNLSKILQINSYARTFINKDDVIGKVYDTIENNVNTKIKLSFDDIDEDRYEEKILAEKVIRGFNKKVNLEYQLRKIIPMTYAEGNYVMYLRQKGLGENINYAIDSYPLKVVGISEFEIDGDPIINLNINELKSRLQSAGFSNRKKKNNLMSTMEEQIKNSYPAEVYKGFLEKDKSVQLDYKYTGVIRINNLSKKYGVTPIFRTFSPLSSLEVFENSDRSNASVKGKKIIAQILRKELLGKEYNNTKHFEEIAYAHQNFVDAWQNQKIVLLTCPAYVEDVKFIETNTKETDIQTINFYRDKILTALGISFISTQTKNSYTVAQINIKELMKTINKIAEQIERVLEKWYRIVLNNNGLSTELTPTVKIIDSELLEMELKVKLTDMLYSKLGCSYKTAFETMGMDINEELNRRKIENEENYDEIFTPHATSYVISGNEDDTSSDKYDKTEENQNKDKEKQQLDKERNDNSLGVDGGE